MRLNVPNCTRTGTPGSQPPGRPDQAETLLVSAWPLQVADRTTSDERVVEVEPQTSDLRRATQRPSCQTACAAAPAMQAGSTAAAANAPRYSGVPPSGSTPGLGTLHVSAQLAQRTYSTNAVRDTTFGSCPQCWHWWITARRIRFSAKRVGFAMRTGEPLIGLFASALMVPTGTATIRVQRRGGGPPLALLLNGNLNCELGGSNRNRHQHGHDLRPAG
jgi:hypothetical protein